MEIGKRIQQLRTQKGVTQQQLADYLSVLPQTVSRWEVEQGCPDVTLLPEIAIFFGVSLDDLFGLGGISKVEHLTIKYSVLRDEKSFNEALQAIEVEESVTKDELEKQRILANKMHLYLQKGRQAMQEGEEIADQLLEMTKEEDNPLHLPIRLQKMQFQITNGNVAKQLKKGKEEYEKVPSMETLLIYWYGLIEIGRGCEILLQYEDDYVQSILKKEDDNAISLWEVLFDAARQAEDVVFFDNHFESFQSIAEKERVFYVRLGMASVYKEKKDTRLADCKDVLSKEVEEIQADEYMKEYLKNKISQL